jgi:hypothetical protein
VHASSTSKVINIACIVYAWPPGPCIPTCMIVFVHVMQRVSPSTKSLSRSPSLSLTQGSDNMHDCFRACDATCEPKHKISVSFSLSLTHAGIRQ